MSKTGSNIYKRKDGRYEGRILVGKNVYRRPQYIYVYAKTLREVKQKMDEARVKNSLQEKTAPFLNSGAHEWLSEKRREWKPTTYDTYSRLVEQYINPVLGNYRIADITTSVMETFSKELDQLSSRKKLSEGYKKYICALVGQIIAFQSERCALKSQALRLPDFKVNKRRIELPDEKDLQLLEDYLTQNLDNDTCLGILLARYTGIRIGELCALQWRDLDLENGLVTIRGNLQRIKNHENEFEKSGTGQKTKVCEQTPKTMKSMRTIPLADGLVEVLKKHQREPERYLISGKRKEWAEVRTVQYRFTSILKKSGCESFHFHLLRHTFASDCICRGCDVKSLSEILGHSSVQVTMNIYVHSTMKQKKEMMNLVCGI